MARGKGANGVFRNRYTKEHYYVYQGMPSKAYPERVDAAKAYIQKIREAEPKYAELFAGKTWRQLFSMMNIEI